MIRGHRNHPLWFAFALHRASGLLLALFLPLHFLVLGMAIDGAEDLDGFLVLTHDPVVKFAEFGLVFLLAVHMFGGLRVLALEFFAWSPRQKTYAAASLAGGFFIACGFLLSAGS